MFVLLYYLVIEGLVVAVYAIDDTSGLADGFEVTGCAFEFAVFSTAEL